MKKSDYIWIMVGITALLLAASWAVRVVHNTIEIYNHRYETGWLRSVSHDGHRFIIRDANSGSIMHHPDCQCGKAKQMATNGHQKSRTELQAETDVAHLCLLLASAERRGLIRKGKVEEDACQAALDEAALADVRPRADLLEPAKLMMDLDVLHKALQLDKPLNPDRMVCTMLMMRIPKQAMTDFQSIWQVTQRSRRDGLDDIGVCREGVVVRMEGCWYLLDPRALYSGVAESYGLPIERLEKRGGRDMFEKEG